MAGIAGDDRDRPADGVAPEQGALRPFQDLNPVDIEHGGVGPHAAGQVDAVDIDADARVQVEGEVVLADAADIGREHRVGTRERGAGVQRHVRRDVAELGDVVDALLLQRLGGHRGDGDRDVLDVLGGLLGGDHHLLDRARLLRRLGQRQGGRQQPGQH